MKKGFSLLSISLLLVVVTAIALTVIGLSGKSSHETTLNGGWSRYINTDYSISFQYPPGWTITRDEATSGRLAIELSNNTFGTSQLYFRVLKKSDTNIDAWKQRMTTEDPDSTTPNYTESREITVSGIPAWQLIASERNLNGDVTGVISNGHLYDLRLLTDLQYKDRKSELNEIYEQVVGTVELR